jgi:hypothetical protein
MMPLYWLCYRHNNSIFVVIEPGPSLIHANHLLGLRIVVLYEAYQLACNPPIERHSNQTNQKYRNDNYSGHSGKIPGEVHHLFLGTSTEFEPCKRRYQPKD